jgi:hypothetical protein
MTLTNPPQKTARAALGLPDHLPRDPKDVHCSFFANKSFIPNEELGYYRIRSLSKISGNTLDWVTSRLEGRFSVRGSMGSLFSELFDRTAF